MEREPLTRFSRKTKALQLSLDLAFLKKINITIDIILKSSILLQSSWFILLRIHLHRIVQHLSINEFKYEKHLHCMLNPSFMYKSASQNP